MDLFLLFTFLFVKSEALVENKGGAQLNMNLIVGYSYMLKLTFNVGGCI